MLAYLHILNHKQATFYSLGLQRRALSVGGEWLLRCPESRPGLSSFPERRTTAKRGKDKREERK